VKESQQKRQMTSMKISIIDMGGVKAGSDMAEKYCNDSKMTFNGV
jgi:dihydroorotate dehydrogenase